MTYSPIWISLKTAFTATCITFFTGIAAARVMLGYRGRGRTLIDGLLMLPLVLPPTVVGFILLLVFGKNGPVGRVLLYFGASVVFSWPATVVTAAVVAFPLMYRTTLAAFEQLDPNLIQAGQTLGASEFIVLRRLMLPLAWPGITAATALAFARALGEFGATLMLAGNIPGQTQTLPLAIFFAVEAGEGRQAVIWSLLVIAISLVAVAGIQRWSHGWGWFGGWRADTRRRITANRHGSEPHVAVEGDQETEDFILRSGSHENRATAAISSPALLEDPTAAGLKPTVTAHIPPRDIKSAPASQVDSAEPIQEGIDRVPPPGGRPLLYADFKKHFGAFAIDIKFEANGSPLAVIGASGSGKTMLLRTIAGLETPDRGRIVLNGRVLFDSERHINLPSRMRQIGFLFQDYALFPNLTVAENIGFGLYGLPRQTQAQSVDELVERLQLRGLENRLPRQLSGGQQQRVALARALAITPQALFLDEPLSALDTYLRNQVEMELVEILGSYSGATLYVTHNMEEAYRISKNLLVMAAGKQIVYGPKEEIFSKPPSYAVARVTGCKNFSRTRAVSPGLVEAIDWGCTLRVAQPVPDKLRYVGIRAHHLAFSNRSLPEIAGLAPSETTLAANPARGPEPVDTVSPRLAQGRLSAAKLVAAASSGSDHSRDHRDNTFPCWLAKCNESPFGMTIYVRLHSAAARTSDYHLQAELSKDTWAEMKVWKSPWQVSLAPDKLFLMGK